ncbi:SGNH/GDSL hydrolase family protein [Okibacterium fritillariae]|uniref:GDSL-like Lipase/Acylhydrolase family protein n=1 Tax=Okibacterium fritillariae TaxID=123320 RepID=A0A1T5KZP7_9MICO|nr:SGNH/GDSL hydrolase family protein [Okibacterium fritillariae]SKC69266.1 GDSL-like Lipase/Acylhydrolase family protein [Okibacterium fritillariae]
MSTNHPSEAPGRAFTRRSLLQGAAAGAAGLLLAGGVGQPAFAAATRPYIPASLTYAPTDPLAGFFQKVATGTASIVFNGDSITEAYGAANPQEGYPALLLDRLRRSKQQPLGGLGYVPARYQFSGAVPKPVTATYLTYYGKNNNVIDIQASTYNGKRSTQEGLGRRSVLLEPTVITSMSFTQKFTSIRIAYRAQSAGTTFSVQIGSGAPKPVAPGSVAEGTFTMDPIASAQRTVTVTAVTGGVFIEGFDIYDSDEKAGFQAIESSQSGSMTWQFSAASGAPVGLGTGTGSSGWANSLVRYEPDLIASMWGTNDYANQVPPADVTTHTINYLTLMHAKKPAATKLIIMPYEFGAKRTLPWSDYVKAQTDAVAAFLEANPNAKVGFFDLGKYIPKYFGATSATTEFMSDGIHPNSHGYDVIAAILYVYFTSKPA